MWHGRVFLTNVPFVPHFLYIPVYTETRRFSVRHTNTISGFSYYSSGRTSAESPLRRLILDDGSKLCTNKSYEFTTALAAVPIVMISSIITVARGIINAPAILTRKKKTNFVITLCVCARKLFYNNNNNRK